MIPKYRVWFSEASHMITDNLESINLQDETVTITSGYYDSFADDYIFGSIEVAIGNAILMQSTGLKDKNGVEIYEGDIVRYTWDSPSDVNATEKGKKVRISKVFWSDWRASWAVGKKSCNANLFRFARNGNTVEVIGNIYENKELLGDTDA